MLVLHEVHRVAGREADRFEALYRDAWAPAVAETSGARLLWFTHQAHGTGRSYVFVTLTAVASSAALDDLDDRIRRGDLRTLMREVDALRLESVAKVLETTAFSPMTELDLGAVSIPPAGGEPAGGERVGGNLPLFMEDTAWPHPGRMDDYLARAGTLYVDTLQRAAEHGYDILELVAAFVPRYGSGQHREVVLWQRVKRPELLLPLLAREVPPEHRAAGTWMHDALEVRDQWESRLLRVSPWSPMR